MRTNQTVFVSRDAPRRSRGQLALTAVVCLIAACGGGGSSGSSGNNGMSVTPSSDFVIAGVEGGPFTPTSKTYTIKNHSNDPMDWAVNWNEAWLAGTPSSGTLAPGASIDVVLSLNTGVANALSPSQLTDTITVTDVTNTKTKTFDAQLSVLVTGSVNNTSITANGITWTFDQEYVTGQFANGDWWVVGPVVIEEIDPPSTTSGGRTKNGSMINPSPADGTTQGYDSELYTFGLNYYDYDPMLNVAVGVNSNNPLVVDAGSSLVSTISVDALAQAQLQAAAVLTVLNSAPAVGSFRPPYSGADKTVNFHVDDLQGQMSLLQELAPVADTPTLASMEAAFEHVWLDHVPTFYGRQHHPRNNMEDYGRDIAAKVGEGALMLHLDFTEAEKETLLIRMVQLGIDLYGIVEDGGTDNWPANGGHGSGRKFPIIFAGLMLDDTDMKNIGQRNDVHFGEDCQTFFVEETGVGEYNNGIGGYNATHEDMPEWGYWHCNEDKQIAGDRADDVDWYADAYRLCCTANAWNGYALALHLMDAEALWNHDAFFAYLDRYAEQTVINNDASFEQSWSPFSLAMWNAYRDNSDWEYTEWP